MVEDFQLVSLWWPTPKFRLPLSIVITASAGMHSNWPFQIFDATSWLYYCSREGSMGFTVLPFHRLPQDLAFLAEVILYYSTNFTLINKSNEGNLVSEAFWSTQNEHNQNHRSMYHHKTLRQPLILTICKWEIDNVWIHEIEFKKTIQRHPQPLLNIGLKYIELGK